MPSLFLYAASRTTATVRHAAIEGITIAAIVIRSCANAMFHTACAGGSGNGYNARDGAVQTNYIFCPH